MQGVRLLLAPEGNRGGDCIYSITCAIFGSRVFSHWFALVVWYNGAYMSTIDALVKPIDGKGGHDECHTYKGSIQYSSVQFCMLSLVCLHCLSAYTDLEERRDNGEQ